VAANIQGKWEVPLDPRDPVNTPKGVAPAAMPAMLDALKTAAQKLQRLKVAFDARLGDYQGDTRNGIRVPIHGAIGDIDGSYNSIHMSSELDSTGYHDVAWGTSYVQTVSFDNSGPVAQAMLLYGQSTDPKSPWYADQLPLYSRKQWTTLPFAPVKAKADPAYKAQILEE
jgi:acyl-homoserine-lactone acylase